MLAITEQRNVGGRSKSPCERIPGGWTTALISLNRLQWAHACDASLHGEERTATDEPCR